MLTREDLRDYFLCHNYYYYLHNADINRAQFADLRVDINELLMQKLMISDYSNGKVNYRKNAMINVEYEYDDYKIIMDALVKTAKGYDVYFTYYSSAIRVSEKKIIDISLQVLRANGVVIDHLYVVILNQDYILENQLDVEQLLVIQSRLKNRYANIKLTSIKHKSFVNLAKLHQQIQRYQAVDDLKCTLKNRCAACNICISRQRQKQLAHSNDDKPAFYFDKPYLKHFIKGLTYPYIYLDFEWTTMPIPQYPQMRVNEMMPFQYSMHIEDANGMLDHDSFIGKDDCREAMIKQLLAKIPSCGSVIAYNAAGGEKVVLKKLQQWYPKYADELEDIINRLVDLESLFTNQKIYHEAFNNSYSLKTVVSVLCNQDYQQLSASSADQAIEDYLAYQTSGYRDKQVLKSLKDYCGMDTYSEYLLIRFIKQKIKEGD